MKNGIRTIAIVSVLVLGVAGVAPRIARADGAAEVHGIVERLPGTPGHAGQWSVAGHTLTVDRQTRLEQHGTDTTGFWTQAATGVVLRAPGWTADTAQAAGFRPATVQDVATFRPGRVVKAKVEPGADGWWYVTKVELDH